MIFDAGGYFAYNGDFNMETVFYLVRHGQSLGNKNGVFLGHTDLDLSELGYIQAEKTAERLADIHFDAIISSDLIRAYNTALPSARLRGMTIEKDRLLREIYAGEWENRSVADLIKSYPEEYDSVWRHDIGHSRPNGGESFSELRLRVCSEIRRLSRLHPGQTILAATHATPIRALYAEACGIPDSLVSEKTTWAPNASVSLLRCDGCSMSFDFYGDDSHLPGIESVLPPNV